MSTASEQATASDREIHEAARVRMAAVAWIRRELDQGLPHDRAEKLRGLLHRIEVLKDTEAARRLQEKVGWTSVGDDWESVQAGRAEADG